MQQTFIGESTAILALQDEVSRLAPINRPLLIMGERGTGKEMIAERVHFLSERWEQSFIKINCAAFSEQLLDSELFGHETGAFTGANKLHRGVFEQANNGTLFLDELATLSVGAQEKLLRIIEYGEFQRVGGQQTITTDVRVIAATNGDIVSMAQKNTFRADLLDRLAFDVLHLPPLREREGDIELLANHFALKMTQELGREMFAGFTQQAMQQLLDYLWPGNIRELKNVVERSIAHHQQEEEIIDKVRINPFQNYVPLVDRNEQTNHKIEHIAVENVHQYPIDYEECVENYSKKILQQALQDHQYNQKETAIALAINYDRIRYLVRKWNLK